MSDFRLCNRLKVARAEKSLSQEQLALLAGVTRQTISSIETGQYNPSALLALTLAVGGIVSLILSNSISSPVPVHVCPFHWNCVPV